MCAIVGPVLARAGGYAFDTWTLDEGTRRGYVYPRIEDAYYARAIEVQRHRRRGGAHAKVCDTVDEFALEAAWQAEVF